MSDTPIYMDHHATTPVDPHVLEVMLPYFCQKFGNPASVNHVLGWEAREAVEQARATIARGIGANPEEIYFTSGATESDNLAIRGLAESSRRRGRHAVSVCTEHKGVLDPLARLAREGWKVTLLPVEPAESPAAGLVDLERLSEAIGEETALVSVMLANNEIGVLQPVAEIGALCRERGVPFHCDATQGVGKISVDVDHLGVDLLSFSAHKLYGPKGIGALYVRRRGKRTRLESQILGGGHEGGLRSGTLNVPAIVGFARAIELCLEERESEACRLTALRDRLFTGLSRVLPQLRLNGPSLDRPDWRLPGNLNIALVDVDGEAVMLGATELAVSSGAACSSAQPEPSHVLRGIGLSDDLVRSSLRFGLGRFNTNQEVDRAIELIAGSVHRLRKLANLGSS